MWASRLDFCRRMCPCMMVLSWLWSLLWSSSSNTRGSWPIRLQGLYDYSKWTEVHVVVRWEEEKGRRQGIHSRAQGEGKNVFASAHLELNYGIHKSMYFQFTCKHTKWVVSERWDGVTLNYIQKLNALFTEGIFPIGDKQPKRGWTWTHCVFSCKAGVNVRAHTRTYATLTYPSGATCFFTISRNSDFTLGGRCSDKAFKHFNACKNISCQNYNSSIIYSCIYTSTERVSISVTSPISNPAVVGWRKHTATICSRDSAQNDSGTCWR